jgi:hypothetical protein
MFIAEREQFDFVNYPVNANDGHPFLNMYISTIDGAELRKPRTFSKALNTAYHDGPGCITSDGQTLYFTRVGKEKRSAVNHAKIYSAARSDRNWKDIKPLSINSKTSGCAPAKAKTGASR